MGRKVSRPDILDSGDMRAIYTPVERYNKLRGVPRKAIEAARLWAMLNEADDAREANMQDGHGCFQLDYSAGFDQDGYYDGKDLTDPVTVTVLGTNDRIRKVGIDGTSPWTT